MLETVSEEYDRSIFMRAFIDWLMRDEQHELFEILLAVTLNLLFLGLVALLLWPLGKATMAFRLAQGYGLLWFVLDVTVLLLIIFRRIFRVDIDTHFDAYVISALIVSSFLQAGWSAFAALTVRGFVSGAPVWMTVLLYVVGVLSCYIAFVIVASSYEGQIYKLVNIFLALVSYIVFCVWPRGGRLLYGWLFNLFEKALT
ncbi:MAG TPA: hypothetical protein VF666_21630 [Pyrinomonadaceae bacterium]